MKIIPLHLNSVLLAMSILAGRADQDVKITLNEAPAAVQKAAKDHAGSGRIIRVEKADEDGQVQYEVLTKNADRRKIEYILKTDGSLDSTEEKLGKNALPAAVAGMAKTAVADGKIEGVEKVAKNGVVTYEVGYESPSGAKQEAVISSEGKLLKNGVDAD